MIDKKENNKFFKAARILKIKEIITENKQVNIKTLSSTLGVSNVTIHSDLKLLEQDGFLYCTHGGAVLRESTAAPAKDSAVSEAISKLGSGRIMEIAAVASDYIADDSWIFLGSGSTCCALAEALSQRKINIVTNNLKAATLLSASPTVNVLLTGGNLFKNNAPFLYGDLFFNSLSNILFDKSFVGVSGIDKDFGFSVSNAVECSIFSKIKQISKETIVIADSSKFGKTSFMGIGSLNNADTIITDSNIPEDYRSYFNANNLKLLTSS